jgi:predicted nucleic acid-binding protein
VPVVVLDTDAVSLLHRRQLEPAYARYLIGSTAAITFVTLGELYKGMETRSWGERRRNDLAAWVDRLLVLPYSDEVAHTWGRLAAAAQRRGRPRPGNDTWIAACCITDDAPLLTLNRRDFEDFARHDRLRLLEGTNA